MVNILCKYGYLIYKQFQYNFFLYFILIVIFEQLALKKKSRKNMNSNFFVVFHFLINIISQSKFRFAFSVLFYLYLLCTFFVA